MSEDAFAPDTAETKRTPSFVSVPRVATPEMIAAAAGWRERDRLSGLSDEADMFERIYYAMVAARPSPSQT